MNELPYQFAWLLWAQADVMSKAKAVGARVRAHLEPSPLASVVAAAQAAGAAAVGIQAIQRQAQEKPWQRLMK